MSASREKKSRQEMAAQEGYVDIKAQEAAKKTAEQKRSSALYITIAVVFVIVGIFLAIVKSGVIQKNATAVVIDDKKFSVAQVNYFYFNAYSNVRENTYASYYGIDTNTPLDQQNMNDLAKMFLGVTDEGDVTWDAYLKNTAITNLGQVYRIYAAAEAAGFEFSDELQSQFDENLSVLESYASMSGYSGSEYVKMLYGKTMDMNTFKDLMKMVLIAQAYSDDYRANLNYTEAEMEEYYQNDKSCFDFADYECITFDGNAYSTTKEDGTTVEPTEEESAAAAEAALAAVADASERYANGESLSDIAESYSDIATYNHAENTASDGSLVSEWVFDEARAEGDITTISNENTHYLVLFHSVARPEYRVANVRHILFSVDMSSLDTASATFQADSQALWDEAKEKSLEVMDTWKAGPATAESFAELANQFSDDTGSNTTGGLYENVAKNGQYVAEFQDWCMDSARKVGDCDIITTDYGYHIMYLDSFGDPYWMILVRDEMTSSAVTEWLNGIVDGMVINDGNGMKYVG